MKHLITAECVSEGHPDKVADKISDSILTYYKIHDSQAHVACETLVAQNLIVLAGEVKSFHKATKNSLYEVVRETLKSIGYLSYACKAEFINNLVSQSPEIALGADKHAAGDQGIMHGYATAETEEKLPLVQLIAARLMAIHDVKRKEKDSPFYPDAKSQVTIDYSGNLPKIKSVTLALSNKEETDSDFLKDYAQDLICEAVEGYTFLLNDNIEVTVNGTGSFVQHGPSVDCGLTGRKIVIDQIPNHVVGGGAFCLPKNTLIRTDSGEKRIKDITTADNVLVRGVPYQVTNVIMSGSKPKYKVTLNSGKTFEFSAQHKVKVPTEEGFKFVEVEELQQGDYIVLDPHSNFGKTSIKESYLIGAILGDGWLSKGDNSINLKLSVEDDSDSFEEEFNQLFGNTWKKYLCNDGTLYKYYYCDRDFRTYLEGLGLTPCGARKKEIPEVYFTTADRDSIKALIQGMIDTDGCISLTTGGNTDTIAISYASTSEGLVTGLATLLERFGIYARISKVEGGWGKIYFRGEEDSYLQDSYQLTIKGLTNCTRFKESIGCRLSRKADRLENFRYPESSRRLIPGLKRVLSSEYWGDYKFKRFIEDSPLSSARKTFNESGPVSKRGKEVTEKAVLQILEYPELNPFVRERLKEAVDYHYDSVESVEFVCEEEMMDLTVAEVSEFVASGVSVHNSGKDLTKVDRSAAYLCRYIAKHMVAAGISKEVSVHLAYTIGQFTPDSFRIDTHGQSKTQFTDAEISTMMKHIISTDTRDVTKMFEGTNFPHYCNYSHYFNQTAPWEVIQTPLVLEIQKTFF